MDKLTIEEKAKRYVQALDRAKKLYEQGTITESLSYVFPELNVSEDEDEDEKIRKELIKFVKVNIPNEERYIAWLEKQGEPTDINPSEFDLHLNKLLKQFETLPKEELASSLSFYLNVVQNDGTYREEKQGEQKPATIDIDKMVNDYANNKERGNEEFGKPVLCMIRAYRQGLNDAIGKVVLKPAWSEEDEKMVNNILTPLAGRFPWNIYQPMYDWLKSLKDRIEG